MPTRYKVVDSPQEEYVSECRCGRYRFTAKVVDVRTGKVERRCRRCIRYLRHPNARRVARRLLQKDMRSWGKTAER
jgi:predicted SprT family Zn-dependent metalloprotease